jgi:hypothetical protein
MRLSSVKQQKYTLGRSGRNYLRAWSLAVQCAIANAPILQLLTRIWLPVVVKPTSTKMTKRGICQTHLYGSA